MIPIVFTLLLSLAMLVVIVLDATRYIIPNSLNLAILALYPLAVFFLGLAFPMAFVAAALVLFVGLGMFALGLMGGGDIKLLVVLTLWTGWSMATVNFLMLTALFGGVLVIIVLPLRTFAPLVYKAGSGKNLPRILTAKEPVPYGLAIAAGFLALLWSGGVAGLARPF